MPSSRPETIAKVVNLLIELNPNSVLDVGPGFGKWGLLLREYLEVWQKRLLPETWVKQIDALEVFEPYTKLPGYQLFYDNVMVGNVMDYLDILGGYDCVLFLDIIEHLEKKDGKMILSLPKRWIVSTPSYDSKQGPGFGNIYEEHKSVWTPADFLELGGCKPELIEGKWIIAWK